MSSLEGYFDMKSSTTKRINIRGHSGGVYRETGNGEKRIRGDGDSASRSAGLMFTGWFYESISSTTKFILKRNASGQLNK